jgi:tetratricopeptide (TPR) repeat protein
LKHHMMYSVAEKGLTELLLDEPDNISLYQSFAMVCHELGKYEKAIETYERIIELDSNQAMSLNNLAWILVTAPDEGLRDRGRALDLAKKAVALERSAVFLDTLAEAYYENGFVNEAVETIKEAISTAKDNRGYYEKQLEKFLETL